MQSRGRLDRNDIPPIYVSEPGYDDMGDVLDALNLGHEPLASADLERLSDAVVMLNCHRKWRSRGLHAVADFFGDVMQGDGSAFGEFVDRVTGSDSSTDDAFTAFVERGGSAIVSDYAGEVLTECTDATFDTSTSATTVTASVEHAELAELLGHSAVDLEFDLQGWYRPTSVPRGSTPLLRDRDTGDVLAYRFTRGRGRVVYTAFHNHAQTTDLEQGLLELLLLLPIAESTETTIAETYTTITGESVAEGGGTIVSDSESSDRRTQPTVGDSSPSSERIVVELVVDGGGRIERRLTPGDTLEFGRDDFSGIPASDRQYLSGTHFAISADADGTLSIRDLNSSNGTAVNARDISHGADVEVSDGVEVDLAGGAARFVVRRR